MANLIWNERVKLFANTLDRAATASVSVGVIAPVAGFFSSSPGSPAAQWLGGSLYGAIWFLAGVALHSGAQMVLGRLKE